MTTPLSRAIDALSTPDVRAAEALRSLFVVSKRLGDLNLTNWVRFELDSYPPESPLPAYRTPDNLPITLTFHGAGGREATLNVTDAESPKQLRLGETRLRQPLAELEALANGNSDPGINLGSFWMAQYRAAVGEGKAPGYSLLHANYARQLFPAPCFLASLTG